ncbi:MAG: hypothetical protein AAGN46_11060 [Acidobacteriota bacterium]
MTDQPDDLAVEIVRQLRSLAAAELRRHPQQHLAREISDRPLRVALELPLSTTLNASTPTKDLQTAAERLRADVRAALDRELDAEASLRPGRVLNRRTLRLDGDDTAPSAERQVFVGWGQSGVPRFEDFGQWLVTRGDPRQERLFAKPPALVTVQLSRAEAQRELLDAFAGGAPADWRLDGQVMAGWFSVPGRDGRRHSLALSLQAVSIATHDDLSPTSTDSAPRRRMLSVVGTGPGGEPLAATVDRLGGDAPWLASVAWAQASLSSILGDGPEADERVDGILRGLARRLEQGQRARARRTRHAERRHREGDRPTRDALRDLQRAGADDIVRDRRHDTLVVLGERGRAHAWSTDGRLVTSLRSTPAATERKRTQGIWSPAGDEALEALRRAVAARDRQVVG